MANTLTKKRLAWAFGLLVALFAAVVATVWMLNVRGETPVTRVAPVAVPASPAQIERGKYLAQAGNCISCHTVRGGPAYAGGRGIDTPFGAVYAPNLTPHAETGMGTWSPDHFWRAMHHGRSKDGRLLYPAFPYTEYTHVTREDSDAIFAYLHSLPPVAQPNRDHTLRFPYNSQWALEDVVALLKTGIAPHGSVMGPMAEVVFNSTQHLSDADAHAMAVYLRALPQESIPAAHQRPAVPAPETMRLGAQVYDQQCAQCHGASGEGQAGAFPALADNRAVTMDPPINAVQAVLHGGYLPATAGNPRPFGMPPFTHVLNDAEVAAVLSFVRASWGNQAVPVTAIEVYKQRESR